MLTHIEVQNNRLQLKKIIMKTTINWLANLRNKHSICLHPFTQADFWWQFNVFFFLTWHDSLQKLPALIFWQFFLRLFSFFSRDKKWVRSSWINKFCVVTSARKVLLDFCSLNLTYSIESAQILWSTNYFISNSFKSIYLK